MERRQLLKQSVFALAAFSFSRNSYAKEEAALLAHHPLNNATDIIRLGQNENPHGPSSMTKKAMLEAKREEYSIVALCLKHRISEATLNKWNKDFINANKYKIF